MNRKAILQYILFFVINLCTVQVIFANYERTAWKCDSHVLPVAHRVSHMPPIPSPIAAGVHEFSTDVIMVVKTDEGVLTQRFNSEEIALLTRLSHKIGKTNFDKLMVRHHKNKAELMVAARRGLGEFEMASIR